MIFNNFCHLTIVNDVFEKQDSLNYVILIMLGIIFLIVAFTLFNNKN